MALESHCIFKDEPCHPKFSLEDDTLYYGRCQCFHGYNLGQLTDRSYNALDILNSTCQKIVTFDPGVLGGKNSDE